MATVFGLVSGPRIGDLVSEKMGNALSLASGTAAAQDGAAAVSYLPVSATGERMAVAGARRPADASAAIGPAVKGQSAQEAANENHRYSTTDSNAMSALFQARYELRNLSETPDQAARSVPRIRQLQDQIEYLEVVVRDERARLRGDVRSLESRRDDAAARGDLASVADYWARIGELEIQIDEIGRFLSDTTAYPPQR